MYSPFWCFRWCNKYCWRRKTVLESAGLIILLPAAFLWQKRNMLRDAAYKYHKGSWQGAAKPHPALPAARTNHRARWEMSSGFAPAPALRQNEYNPFYWSSQAYILLFRNAAIDWVTTPWRYKINYKQTQWKCMFAFFKACEHVCSRWMSEALNNLMPFIWWLVLVQNSSKPTIECGRDEGINPGRKNR